MEIGIFITLETSTLFALAARRAIFSSGHQGLRTIQRPGVKSCERRLARPHAAVEEDAQSDLTAENQLRQVADSVLLTDHVLKATRLVFRNSGLRTAIQRSTPLLTRDSKSHKSNTWSAPPGSPPRLQRHFKSKDPYAKSEGIVRVNFSEP